MLRVKKNFCIIIFLIALTLFAKAQDTAYTMPSADSTRTHTINKKRFWLVAGTHASFWGSTYIALNKAWYANYPRSSFHAFNDNTEWAQMDKIGHLWTAYNISRASTSLWKWTGLSTNKSIMYGAISAIAYQSIIEIQDGYSAQWGFSWGDMAANIAGAGTYAVQELVWKQQRIQIKMSYWPYKYATDLINRRNQLFGKSVKERMLKDYNSQTYWISANLKSFFPKTKIPAWLNLSFGYAANGMLGATHNIWTDKQGVIFNKTNIPRVRYFLFAPDIDITKIKTKSKLLKTVFFVVNSLKIPAPTIKLNSAGKLSVHAF